MTSTMWKLVLGIALVSGAGVSVARAEEAAKPLPVLLIKGEIVSLDTNDPALSLLKVKDRYGFETPIYVTSEAKITQGGTAITIAGLATGTTVDVEYNFDVNTAKRHAVSVKVPTPAAAASVASVQAPAAVPATPPVTDMTPPAPAPSPEPTPESPEDASTDPDLTPEGAPATDAAAPVPSEDLSTE